MAHTPSHGLHNQCRLNLILDLHNMGIYTLIVFYFLATSLAPLNVYQFLQLSFTIHMDVLE